MKANTVTQANKINFPKNAVGDILEFTEVPQKWIQGKDYHLGFRDKVELHAAAGFLDVVLAPINALTQYHGPTYKDGNVYRKDALNKTPEVIAAETEQREDDEAMALEIQQEQDGQNMYRDIRKRIRLAKNKGQLDDVQFNLIRRNLRPALLPLINGDFDIAKELIDALPIPPVGPLRTTLNTVKILVNNYITEVYSKTPLTK